jgi:hypothetical protein
LLHNYFSHTLDAYSKLEVKIIMSFRNYIAAFGWGISVFFLLGCTAFTYILIRDGVSHIQINPPENVDYYPPWFMPVVLAVFWLGGYGLAVYVASKPCVRVTVLPDKSVTVSKRYPFKTEVHSVQAGKMNPAQLVETRDSESEPYFYSRITLPNDDTVDIAEGNQRELCEAACDQFNGAISS